MVRQAKLLSILLSNILLAEAVNALLCSFNQSFHLLKMFRNGGLLTKNLNVIHCAVVVNHTSYSLLAI
jgi:hypothetical protein